MHCNRIETTHAAACVCIIGNGNGIGCKSIETAHAAACVSVSGNGDGGDSDDDAQELERRQVRSLLPCF